MKLSRLTIGAACLLLLAGCSKDKDDNDKTNPDGPQGNGEMSVMTPEQSKKYLQQTATEFLDLFKPADQKQAIELASYFAQEYGDYDLPADFEIEADPRSYIRALGEAAQGNLDALTRAAFTYTYHIGFDRFTGIYEPVASREEWTKTGDSKDIIFRFNNKNAQQVELKITQSGGTSEADFTVIDKWRDWYWDSETGEYDQKENTDTYIYYLSIPKTVQLTLTENGTQLAASTVLSSIDIKNHTVDADVSASLCNLAVKAIIKGTDARVEANTEFLLNGNQTAYAYATVTGKDLCNKDKWQTIVNADDDDIVENMLASMLEKADCGLDVMGKVQAYGQASYYRQMSDDLDFYYSYWEEDASYDKGQRQCQEACNRLNSHVTTQLRYDKTVTDQASLKFVPYYYPGYEGKYWDWTVETNILFPDGTSYSIDSYFDKFTNVSNKWEALINAYEKVWDSARTRR